MHQGLWLGKGRRHPVQVRIVDAGGSIAITSPWRARTLYSIRHRLPQVQHPLPVARPTVPELRWTIDGEFAADLALDAALIAAADFALRAAATPPPTGPAPCSWPRPPAPRRQSRPVVHFSPTRPTPPSSARDCSATAVEARSPRNDDDLSGSPVLRSSCPC